MANRVDIVILKQAVLALGSITEISSKMAFNEVVFAIGGALMAFMKIEKRYEKTDDVGIKVKDFTSYIFEAKGRNFDKRKVKSKLKAIYTALNEDKDFIKIKKPVVDFNKKVDEIVNQFREFILEFLSRNIGRVEKKPKTIEDGIMFEASKIVANSAQSKQDIDHLKFIKEKLVPDLREDTDWVRSKHQEILNILSCTKTQLVASPDDEDFIFYYTGINHMLREVVVNIIEMMDKNDFDPYKIIMDLHNIELINNAHLFNEKDKLFLTFGKEEK